MAGSAKYSTERLIHTNWIPFSSRGRTSEVLQHQLCKNWLKSDVDLENKGLTQNSKAKSLHSVNSTKAFVPLHSQLAFTRKHFMTNQEK